MMNEIEIEVSTSARFSAGGNMLWIERGAMFNPANPTTCRENALILIRDIALAAQLRKEEVMDAIENLSKD